MVQALHMGTFRRLHYADALCIHLVCCGHVLRVDLTSKVMLGEERQALGSRSNMYGRFVNERPSRFANNISLFYTPCVIPLRVG